MRRDMFFIYDKPVAEVFNAYRQAIKTVFNTDADAAEFHSITFGLNFSFKYNMNGGACHVHFIPYGNGTAVRIRYSIAQLVGARYAAHCKDMVNGADKVLGIESKPAKLDMEQFLKDESKTVKAEAPVQRAPEPSGAKTHKFCAQCGTKLDISANFCISCGKKQ